MLNFNSAGPGTQRRLPLQKAHSKTRNIHFKLLKGNYFTKIISHVKAALANCTVYGYFVSHLQRQDCAPRYLLSAQTQN